MGEPGPFFGERLCFAPLSSPRIASRFAWTGACWPQVQARRGRRRRSSGAVGRGGERLDRGVTGRRRNVPGGHLRQPAGRLGDGRDGDTIRLGHYTFFVRAARGSAPAARDFAVTATPAPLPAPAQQPPAAQPPPVPTPTATPQPRYGKSVVVRPTRGTVKVRPPGTKRYDAVDELPLGSSIDVRKGRVRLYAARDRAGRRQSAQFHAGVFRVVQRGGVIELQLRGPVPTCGVPRARRSTAKKKRTRRLWGSGRGRFVRAGTTARRPVRGTTWLVEDRCRSILTRVEVGVVRVRDFGRRRSILVRAGTRYVARQAGEPEG